MSEIMILVKKPCTHCDHGMIYNPLWAEFNTIDDDHRLRTGHFMTEEECAKWFSEHGHSGKLPPEEYKCEECLGTTEIKEWITISQFIKLMEDSKTKAFLDYIAG